MMCELLSLKAFKVTVCLQNFTSEDEYFSCDSSGKSGYQTPPSPRTIKLDKKDTVEVRAFFFSFDDAYDTMIVCQLLSWQQLQQPYRQSKTNNLLPSTHTHTKK